MTFLVVRRTADGMEPRLPGGGAADPSVLALRIELLGADGSLVEVPGSDLDWLGDGWRISGEAAGMRVMADVRSARPAPWTELRVEAHCIGPAAFEGGLRVSLELPHDPARQPSWLIPGAFYGENRPLACRRIFPRYDRATSDPQAMVSPSWSFRADRAATPSVFGWSGEAVAALAVDERTEAGPAGIGFEGSASRTRIWVDAPFREEPVAYRGFDVPDPPDLRVTRWQPGERLSLTLRAWLGDGRDGHAYAAPLAALRAPAPADTPGTRRPKSPAWVSVEEAAELAAEGLYRWHYHPDDHALYETAAFERELDGSAAGAGDRAAMHVGWVSGAPWAAALLREGRRAAIPDYVAAATDVLDGIAANLSPSGTFWAAWTKGDGWGTGWSPRGTIHANTIGQATLFFLRALAAEGTAGQRHPAWDAAVRSTLDAICARQRDDGNLGTYHDAASGAVTEWDGAGALPFVAALLAAAERYRERRYRAAAEGAGAFYRRFVDDELIYGAPEDVHLAPTSEDGYNALIAFMALHAATRDDAWVEVARRAADWTLTFRYSYDVAFPEETLLGAYGFRTRGADQASPANQHLHHFGLLCLPELLALSRATGDPQYAAAARESLACWRQFVARADGDFNARRGMVSERFYQTDCFRPKGSLLPLSHAWTCGVLLFACHAAMEDPDAVSD